MLFGRFACIISGELILWFFVLIKRRSRNKIHYVIGRTFIAFFVRQKTKKELYVHGLFIHKHGTIRIYNWNFITQVYLSNELWARAWRIATRTEHTHTHTRNDGEYTISWHKKMYRRIWSDSRRNNNNNNIQPNRVIALNAHNLTESFAQRVTSSNANFIYRVTFIERITGAHSLAPHSHIFIEASCCTDEWITYLHNKMQHRKLQESK